MDEGRRKELEKLFIMDLDDALADVRATVRCFWKLKELKVI